MAATSKLRIPILSQTNSGGMNKILFYSQRHNFILIWLMLLILFVFTSSRHMDFLAALAVSCATLFPIIVVILLMRFWMLPHLLHHNHKFLFYLLCVLILVLSSMISVQADSALYHRLINMGMIDGSIHTASEGRTFLHAKWLILLLTTIAGSSISWLIEERKKMEQEVHEQRMQSELKYLKAQINPHFLFNSLNCIYALTVTNDEQAPESVLKLSEMLRYVIDDCSQDEVPLSKEIHYISNYIDFQRIRLEHEGDIRFEVNVEDPSFPIPPMIFQPMIENCFKHSRIIDHPEAFVHISLRHQKGHIYFSTVNSIPQLTYPGEDSERTGIGLKNVEQRLKLLFGERLSFNKEISDNTFKVDFCIRYGDR